MTNPEGTINGNRYPIAVNEQGQVQWQTVDVAREKDEVWDDWSLGMGEDYFFSEGFDGSIRNVLHLSPFYHNDNNPTDLSTGYGYFMEVSSGTGTIAYDATSSDTGDDTITVSHTVAAGDYRVLIAELTMVENLEISDVVALGYSGRPTFAGQKMTSVGSKGTLGAVKPWVFMWFLPNPPVGANDFVIELDDEDWKAAVSVRSYTGVETSTIYGGSTPALGSFVGAVGTSTTPSVAVVSATNELVIDTVASASNTDPTKGAGQTERWDEEINSTSRGMGSEEAGAASVTMSWTAGNDAWAIGGVSLKRVAPRYVYIADAAIITEYKYDPDGGATEVSTQTITNGVAGQPAYFKGKWYAALGNSVNAYSLDSPGTGTRWVDASFKARHLCTFQQGVTPLIVRANSATTNLLESSTDASTWTTFGYAGDTSETVTGMVQAWGQLYVATDQNLYEFGIEGESRPIIPFLNPGNSDTDNGKGLHAFGDTIIYPCNQGAWRYRIGSGALPVGVESLRGFQRVPGITAPKDRRPAFVTSVGEWWYVLQNSADRSLLLQMRQRREGDPSGHEMIIHGALDIPLSKSVFPDSQNNLWLKGASTDEGQRDIRVIQLDYQGGLDTFKRCGQASADHDIYFKERNPGRPQDKVQLRHFTVDLGGDWDATTSLQPKVWLDNGTSAVNFGAAITSAGVTVRNPTTFGTSDTCYRFRPQLTLTTNSSYTPKASDPQLYKVIVGVRFPETIRIVVAADDALLEGMTARDAEQNLRRLQNQGVVAFLPPGTGVTTFNAEVMQVKDVMYQNAQDIYCHGLELIVTRWITA